MASERDENRVVLVTDAQPPRSADLAHRTHQYFISMAIRTLCLGLAIFVLTGWARWIGVAAAIALPYVAVVLANSGPLRRQERPAFYQPERLTLEGQPHQQVGADGHDPTDPLS